MLMYLTMILSLFFIGSKEMISLIMLSLIFLFFSSYENKSSFSSMMFELDSFSYSFIMLSLFLVFACYLSSISYTKESQIFNFFLLFLLLSLIFSFSINDYLMFYIGFEVCLLPVVFLLLGWGYQPERFEAGYYLLFYTIISSFPLFIIIINTYINSSSNILLFIYKSGFINNYLYIFLFLAFLVKFPMYSVHLWLPKAHLEAPVAGSMLLAGILLKLGGYGIIRFLSFLNFYLCVYQSVFISLSLWGGFVVSVMCLTQTDMKLLVALSSVVHMSTCAAGLLIMSSWSILGSMCMMLAHGLSSSALFYLIGLIYSRSNSRSLLMNKGLMNFLPSLTLWWFLILASNMSTPPSINLMSEFLLMIGILNWSWLFMFVLFMIVFFSCAYNLFLFSMSQHGKNIFFGPSLSSCVLLEYLVLFFHFMPLNLFIMCLFYILY